MRFFAPLRRSIFLKLLLIFMVATALFSIAAVYLFHRFDESESAGRSAMHRHVLQYADYIMDDIGNPPDESRAAALADELRLRIHIERPAGWWSSSGSAPDLYSLQFHAVDGIPRARWARHRGRFFLQVQRDDTRYLFSWGRRLGEERHHFLLFLMFAMALTLALAYLAVRWLFRPVKWLSDGVAEISEGRLETRIPVRKHDELGELAESFNAMAERLSEMMRAKVQLLLDVSHELRSPITRMKLALEFIDAGDARRRIKNDLRELEAMVTEILESERLGSDSGALQLERTDLTELVRKIVAQYSDQAPGVLIAGDAAPAVVELDVNRVEIVLRNVIQNALKYSASCPRPVEVSVGEEEAAVVVRVRDFGSGIAEEEQALIFEPFYRVDKSRHKNTGGYGLGLALCRKIMRAHGGEVSVDSRLGAGATFVLTFRS